MSDNNNLPPDWDESDENKVEDSPWGDSTPSDDDGDSSEKSEITHVSNPPMSGNTKLMLGIAGVVVALAIAFFSGMSVFDMFKNDDGEAAVSPSSDVNMEGTTDDGSLGTADPSDNAQTPTVEPSLEPTVEPTSTQDITSEWQLAYERVLAGENERDIVYNDGNNGIELPADDGLGEWPDNYYESEAYTGISLVDFDSNGIPELVIHISGWEWYGCDIYAYKDGSVSYSQVRGNLFIQEKTRTYITALHYDCVYVRTYDLKKGEFVEVDFTEMLEDDFENKCEKEGFVRFEYTESPDFETALSEYLRR